MPKVFDFLELNELIQVMDAGASAIAEVPVYKPLLDNGWAELNAFEGDERQADGITGAYGNRARIYRDFLFDGTEQTLYVTGAPTGMTSLLKPRMPALKAIATVVSNFALAAMPNWSRRLDALHS